MRFAVGRERAVDAICVAGDVYEHEYVSEDTVSFLRDSFAAAGVPVLVTPGNHDPYLPGSAWQRTEWPGNVHVFARDAVEPYPLGDGVTVWGAAFTARNCGSSALAHFRVPPDGGTHLLLIHAALTGEQWADEADYRPVTRAQLRDTGAAYVMLGHFHDGRGDGFLCYPGSPEPLDWGERSGAHGASIVTVRDGAVSAEAIPIATRRYAERTVSVAGASGSAQVEAALSAAVAAEAGASLRVVLTGEIEPGCEVSTGQPGRALPRGPDRARGRRPHGPRLQPGGARAGGIGAGPVRRPAAALGEPRRGRGDPRRPARPRRPAGGDRCGLSA